MTTNGTTQKVDDVTFWAGVHVMLAVLMPLVCWVWFTGLTHAMPPSYAAAQRFVSEMPVGWWVRLLQLVDVTDPIEVVRLFFLVIPAVLSVVTVVMLGVYYRFRLARLPQGVPWD